ncbi:TonB-dependent receptor domain-containing protein [Phenylobacterium sp.]|uniref:TonB-dependent receptor domain-containing protein n=1 Tax=Phenylobacterium sp. TaxID=1871053 RepID=UPI0035B157D8
MQLRTILLAAAGLSALAGGAAADQSGPGFEVGEVIVAGDPLGRSGKDVASSVAVVRGDELDHRRQSTLGETLTGLPGVNSDTFGGGASRPVIRGQTAPRVKVLTDGAALLDASEVSPDHAVSGEPLLLEGVEILRGPSALLYGGGAIGGAVNLIDRKIPARLPDDGFEGAAEVRLGSADNERAGVIGATGGAGNLAIRLELAGRKADDYEVPDWSEKTLDGSFSQGRTATLGLSWIGSRGYLGAAYTEQRSKYGLPGHNHEYEGCHPHGSTLHCGGHGHDDDDHEGHDHDHEHDHEDAPVVDLTSRRFDLRGEIEAPFAGIERIRLRGGYTDYAHDEIDEETVATTFTNKGYDARIEAQHAPVGALRGVFGVQTSRSDFAAVGAESFIPKSRAANTAIFLLEEYAAGDWRFEGALRQEWQNMRAFGRPDASHQPFSASVSASWGFAPGYLASIAVARSQRAPSAQELYARGVHLATNTYEIGDAALDVETANSVELTLKKTDGATTFTASAYRYAYDGYIYASTLDQFEDFRLIRYSQADATFTGVEGELRRQFAPGLSATVFGDYVRAKFDDGGDLPRIPAGRLGLRGDFARGDWSASAEYMRVFEQEKIAAFERRTPGYDMVNATLAYDLALGGFDSQVFVRGTNLLDEKALNHASFIANVAPLRGRNFTLGLRTRF